MTTILQLSDTHVFDDPSAKMYGIDTNQQLKTVIDSIKSYIVNHNITLDAVMVTGDLIQEGADSALDFLYEQILILNPHLQIWIAGNHDHNHILNQYKASFTKGDTQKADLQTGQAIYAFNDWRIITLNTNLAGHPYGFLDSDSITFLKESLFNTQHNPTIIAMHHPPVNVGSPWIDVLGLKNSTDFWQQVEQYSHIKCVWHGHTHQFHLANKLCIKNQRAIPVIGCPATSVGFVPNSTEFITTQDIGGLLWVLDDELPHNFTFKVLNV